MSADDDLININPDGQDNDDTGDNNDTGINLGDNPAATGPPATGANPADLSPQTAARIQFVNVDPATAPTGFVPGAASTVTSPAATTGSPAKTAPTTSPQVSPVKTATSPGLKPSLIDRRATKSPTVPVGLDVSAIEAQQRVVQSLSIEKLVKTIHYHGSDVFQDPRIEKVKYLDDSSNRPLLLIKYFKSVFPGGFINFDDQTFDILFTYLDSCATVFDVVLQKHEKVLFSTQIRLLIIAVAFGIDRALSSLKFKDKLFHHFHTTPQDTFHQHIYDKPELRQRAVNLDTAREYYYDYFRTDNFNPLVNGENVPVFGRTVTYTPVVHHSFSTPVPDQQHQSSFFEDVQDKKLQIHYQEPQSSDTEQEQEIRHSTPKPTKQRQQDPSPSDSDDYYRREPSGRSSRQHHHERPQSRSNSRCSYHPCDIDPRASYTRRRTPSPETETESEEDYDPWKPKQPLQQDLTQNHYSRLSTVGRVYNKDQNTVKRKSRKSNFITAIAKEIQQMGLTEEQRNSIMGTSLGVAHSINAFTKEGQRQQRDTFKVISPPPSDLDLRPDSFDYDRNAFTADEILGKRFSKLRFPSEAVRLSTMRSIFQTVADDPETPIFTRKIARAQLGQFDNPNITKQEVQHYLSKTISRLDTHHDPDIIPPPELGESNLDGRVLKTLQTRLGIDDRLSFDDMTTGLFKSTLRNLASIITNAGLREEEAYALMRRITKGTSQTTAEINEFEHQLPFKDYWITIQKTHRQSSNTEENKQKLAKLLTSDRTDNLHKTLNQIMIYTFKIHEKETDPCYRRLLVQRECLKNFRIFLRRHYSPYFSQINTCFADKLRQMALEENDPSYTNESIYHQRKTQIFLEVACEILSQYEPDEQPRIRQPRHGVYAINQQEHQQQPRDHQQQQRRPQQQQDQRNFRTSTPGPGNRPPSRANNQFQDRPPSRSTTPNGTRRPSYNCHLCNRKGHSYRQCLTYPNEERGPSFCADCGGSHKGECKTKRKNKISNIAPEHQFNNRSSTPYNNFQRQQYQRPPSRNYQQNYQQNQGYDRRPRSQNGYRQNNNGYQRPFTPNGPPRNNYGPKPFYNNYQQDRYRSQSRDGRRSQNGYQRPYYRNDSNNPNYMPMGPRKNSQYNNKQRQYEQKPYRQQDPPQEKPADPPVKQNGLGNAGYQPIPINARLSKIAAESNNQNSDYSDNDQ